MAGKGIYSALSGALAQSQQLDTIANNIANANTIGFKGDKDTFKEHLATLEKDIGVNTVPRIPGSLDSFFDMEGTDKSFVGADGTYTNYEQGGMRSTGNALDVALEGKGFIEVLTPQGTRLTRKGTLSLSADGTLVTTDGNPVLRKQLTPTQPGQAEPAPEARIIRIDPGGEAITFTQQGDVYQGSQPVASLSVVEFEDNEHLKKVGNSLYAVTDPSVGRILNPQTEVHQGFLETSNVNIVKEMTDMIQTTRNFESAQRAIKAYDEMDSKLVNEVPKLG